MRDIEKQNLIFFLGGHDAEMMTIRELLKDNAVPDKRIMDNKLT